MGSRRITALSAYRDQQFQGSMKEQEEKLKASSTLYVGNLAFFTTEDQIYHLFSKSGDVKRVVMGLDRHALTPCGFCFVEFYTRDDAEDALRYVNGTRLDERIVRCDWDAGFVEGRQYGRGRSGGQVRDEFRADYDAGRGGFGKMLQNRVERFGMGGGVQDGQRRFEGRGKRKWNDDHAESPDRVTDLRQKLRRSNPEKEIENLENIENSSDVTSTLLDLAAEKAGEETHPADHTNGDVVEKSDKKAPAVDVPDLHATDEADTLPEDDTMDEKDNDLVETTNSGPMEWIE